jgi:acyl-CoA reductase-like NAD-dependent aldehyde dehydrogenase
MSVRMPLGVCSLITPWNFPMAIPSWKLIPALVCGYTVVIKPASDTPMSCYNLVKVCEQAGIPKGVVNLVTGSGSELGDPLMTHADVKLVLLRGNYEIIADQFRQRRGHFMNPALLQSQFADLEEPQASEGSIVIELGQGPHKLVQEIKRKLRIRR